MQIGLSTDAAPGAAPAEIAAAFQRRGLSVLEVVLAGHNGIDELVARVDRARHAGLTLCGLLADDSGYVHQLAALSRHARAPVVVGGGGACKACEGGAEDTKRRIAFTHSVIAHGGSALALMRGPAAHWLPATIAADVPIAWQVDDSCTDPAADAEIILGTGRLHYIRIPGGGPETIMQEGHGIGQLMSVLALHGYSGPLVLTPSSSRFHVAWSAWLGRRGWGCGSAAETAALRSVTQTAEVG